MTFYRRLLPLLVAAIMLAACVCVRADYTAVVNPNSSVVTNFQGWGTSLCWWANVIGSYPNRTNYVNLAFNTLKLNIVRYNIGGGENPSSPVAGQGYRTIMQGFEPTNGIWNWNVDTNQRWVLQQAETQGANLVDAFANSPPWWMCVNSNCVGNASDTNNLQVNNETNFAIYLATVVSNLTVLDGDHFNYVTPMNEPNGSKWYPSGGPTQEGCDMNPSQQGTVVGILRTQLNTIAPSVGIDAAEDVDPYQTYNDLTSYTAGQLGDVALFTTHTYSFTGASDMTSEAASQKKPLWVSEYGDSDGTGMTMARYIYNGINVMGARAWVYWQVVDSAGGWGFLLNSLLATTNPSYTPNYTINEKFYVMGQFSEFIRPGCNIISVNDTNTLAAWNPTNSTLVLAMVNNTSSSLNVTYNLADFGSLFWQCSATQTDPSENMATLPATLVTNQTFTAAIPASSVTTFVLTVVPKAPVLVSPLSAPATNLLVVYAGVIPTLSVTVESLLPLSYQWFSNSVAIGGVTNAEYTPPTLPASGLPSIGCIVSNTAGSVTSLWSVAVIPQPFASYPQSVLALNPVGYWRLNETPDNGTGNQGAVCHDYVGGNDGVYSNVTLARPGYNPATDPPEMAARFGTYASANSDAGQIQNPDFSEPAGSNGEFSVTAWVNGDGSAQTLNAGIVARGYLGGEEMTLDEGANGTDLRFEVGNATGTASAATSTINLQADTGWHFLAGVCDEANGNVLFYLDGVLVGQAAIPVGSGITNASSVPLSIGARATSATSGNNLQFVGKMNDVAIYNYALSVSQVDQLYTAASVPLMSLTSSNNTPAINFTGELLSSTNVAGPYNPVSGASPPSYTIPLTNSQMFYRVNNQ
jgi:O-glycosyl hydrolase